jgi:histidinol phosphatase-like enzyme (inositol monophosphatase family)
VENSLTRNLLGFASFLADEAAQISRKYFRQHIVIDSKDNKSPVTIADREIELRLRELIKQHYPSHGIIGEEFANHDTAAEFCWVLDPIDGTVAFSTGKPSFTTLVALLRNGVPLLSIIDQAISKERFSGIANHGAWLNNAKLQTSLQTEVANVRLNATTPLMFTTAYERDAFERVRSKVRLTAFGGDAYAFALLAAGHIDVIMEAELQYYDIAALIPVIEGAGGVISDWQGKALDREFNGQVLASANAELHNKILQIINS